MAGLDPANPPLVEDELLSVEGLLESVGLGMWRSTEGTPWADGWWGGAFGGNVPLSQLLQDGWTDRRVPLICGS
jgi:hypothetical protein